MSDSKINAIIVSKSDQMVRYLVGRYKIMKQTRNSMGKTALDILQDDSPRPSNYSVIRDMLISLPDVDESSLLKLSDTTMVVVVLIATMAFQAAVSPPGGVWQDDTSAHKAGKAVMASTHPKIYKHFVRANTTAFVSSLITILLITTDMQLKHIFFLAIAMYATWVSMASIGVSYGASLIMTNPMETQSIGPIIALVVSLFIGILVFESFFVLMQRFLGKRRVSSE